MISFGVLIVAGELKSNADAAVGPTLLFIGLYELVFGLREAGLEEVIMLYACILLSTPKHVSCRVLLPLFTSRGSRICKK